MGCGASSHAQQPAQVAPVPQPSPAKPSCTSSQQVQPLDVSCSSLASADTVANRSSSLQQAVETRKTQRKFEDITKLVFAVFNVDIAAVTLVDEGNCVFESVQGPGGENFAMDTNEACFCSYSVNQESNEVLVVEDAREDARFADFKIVSRDVNPWRFYAGAPLVTGHDEKIGTLCLIGYQPRKLTAQDCAVLRNLAAMVVKEIEHDQMLRERENSGKALKRHNSKLHVLLNSLEDSIMLCEYISDQKTWVIRFVNQPWIRLTDIQPQVAKGADLWTIFDLVGLLPEEAYAVYQEAALHDISFTYPVTMREGTDVYNLLFRPAASDVMPGAASTAIPAHVEEMGNDHTRYLVSVKPALAPTHSSKLLGSRGSRRSSLLQISRQPFDDVKLGPLLGKGGYGRVYRAVWNGAAVACKIIEIPPDAKATVTAVNQEGQEVEDMPVEALLGMDMAHPNVVQTYRHTSLNTSLSADLSSFLSEDKTRTSGSLTLTKPKESDAASKPRATEVWLLLEYCNKGTLRDGIDKGWFRTNRSAVYGLPDLACILATAREVASGMAHLHSLDILHGDLTSLNVLLASSDLDNRSFVAKVADFGLSRVVEAASVETKTYGTITHMPPELLLEGRLSKSADVYAFGVVLFELFTADRAWSGLRHAEVLNRVAVKKEQLQLPADAPEPFRELFTSCISILPEERPTFIQLLDKLDKCQQQIDIGSWQTAAADKQYTYPMELLS